MICAASQLLQRGVRGLGTYLCLDAIVTELQCCLNMFFYSNTESIIPLNPVPEASAKSFPDGFSLGIDKYHSSR
jgi:hypothetical protein